MRRRIRGVLAAATVTLAGLALWAWHARAAAITNLVRVGGAQNPCACTQRIEP